MDEYEESRKFDIYLSWIEAILSLCKNLDKACWKLDQNFPCEDDKRDNKNLHNAKGYYQDFIQFKATQNGKKHETPKYDHSRIKEFNSWVQQNNLIINRKNEPLTDKNPPNYYPNGGMPTKENKNDYINQINYGYYGIKIKGLKKKDLKNKRNECVYNLESSIIKKLNVGEMLYVVKKNTNKENMGIIKTTNDFDYLLDLPFELGPDRTLEHHQYQCPVPGVYWDKKSWIASWYKGRKRYYRSFSAKLHGFHRSKYFAIQTRLFNSPAHEKKIKTQKNQFFFC